MTLGNQTCKLHTQAVLSLDKLPNLALAAIHDALLLSSQDADGFCISPRDAASFRSACKGFHKAAVLPLELKVSFGELEVLLSSLGPSAKQLRLNQKFLHFKGLKVIQNPLQTLKQVRPPFLSDQIFFLMVDEMLCGLA